MANADIGTIECPCCGFDAHVRETVKRKAYIICDECASQTFARGSVSDSSIRRRMKPAAPAVVDPDPAPEEAPAPPKKRAAVPPAPTPAPEPKKGGFGNWLNL